MLPARRNALRLAVAAGVAGVAVGGASPASAHNGVGAAFKGPAGHYEVYAYDGYPVAAGHLEYKLVLLDLATLEPIYDVRAEISASSVEHPVGPTEQAPITTYGNVVFYDLTNPYPDHWRVHVVLRGTLGAGTVDFRMHGAAATVASSTPIVTETGSTSPWIVIGPASGAVVLAAGAVLWWRRRRVRPRR